MQFTLARATWWAAPLTTLARLRVPCPTPGCWPSSAGWGPPWSWSTATSSSTTITGHTHYADTFWVTVICAGTTMSPCFNSAPRKGQKRTMFDRSLKKGKRYLNLSSALCILQEAMQRLQTMCTVMVLAWLMSWTPYLIVFLLPQLGLGHLLTPNVGQSP